jgi:hypothetical protein
MMYFTGNRGFPFDQTPYLEGRRKSLELGKEIYGKSYRTEGKVTGQWNLSMTIQDPGV